MDKENRDKLKSELYEERNLLEIELNQKIKDLKNKWEKVFFKVWLNPINSIQPGYDKDRGGDLQLTIGLAFNEPKSN